MKGRAQHGSRSRWLPSVTRGGWHVQGCPQPVGLCLPLLPAACCLLLLAVQKMSGAVDSVDERVLLQFTKQCLEEVTASVMAAAAAVTSHMDGQASNGGGEGGGGGHRLRCRCPAAAGLLLGPQDPTNTACVLARARLPALARGGGVFTLSSLRVSRCQPSVQGDGRAHHQGGGDQGCAHVLARRPGGHGGA